MVKPARFAAALLLPLLACCTGEAPVLELSGRTMGTGYSVKVANEMKPAQLQLLAERIAERLEALEACFSTYRENSEVSRFNARPGTAWFEVSPLFMEVLQKGMAVSRISDGAFDMTVEPLVELWGFGAGGPAETVPSRHDIDALLEITGFDYLQVTTSPPALRRTRPGVRLDLSAIAKGFAVDEIWTLLDSAGLTAYMVEIGGEIRTRGPRADGRDWTIGVESPLPGHRDGPVQDVVYLRDAAIATSGDYRNFFEYRGTRYSHALDPRTGWPIDHGAASVSVIAESAADADAMATALLVLGPIEGVELARRENLAAQFLVRLDDGLEVLYTAEYEAYLEAR